MISRLKTDKGVVLTASSGPDQEGSIRPPRWKRLPDDLEAASDLEAPVFVLWNPFMGPFDTTIRAYFEGIKVDKPEFKQGFLDVYLGVASSPTNEEIRALEESLGVKIDENKVRSAFNDQLAIDNSRFIEIVSLEQAGIELEEQYATSRFNGSLAGALNDATEWANSGGLDVKFYKKMIPSISTPGVFVPRVCFAFTGIGGRVVHRFKYSGTLPEGAVVPGLKVPQRYESFHSLFAFAAAPITVVSDTQVRQLNSGLMITMFDGAISPEISRETVTG